MKEQSGFVEGVAYALATLNRLHDQPGMCADVLAESGLRVEDFRQVDSFDGIEIRKIFQKEGFRIGNHRHVVAMHTAVETSEHHHYWRPVHGGFDYVCSCGATLPADQV